jgi:hypothetical protein
MIDAHGSGTQIEGMNKDITAELETIALDTARELAGADAVERVEVTATADSYDRPAYQFAFLIDLARMTGDLGVVRLNLRVRLGDELDARGDEHRVLLQTLDHHDWPRRANAFAF